MNKYQKIVVALLTVIAIGTTVTAVEVVKIGRNGFDMELTMEQAEEIADEVNEAMDAKGCAEQDMKAEEGEL